MAVTVKRERHEYVLRTSTVINKPREEVFAFFAKAEHLLQITPPELQLQIRTPLPILMRRETVIDYTIKLRGTAVQWQSEIILWEPPYVFKDLQISGPYAKWIHMHTFQTTDSGGTQMDDEVRYQLRGGFREFVTHPIMAMKLKQIFRYRETTIRAAFQDK